LGDDPADWHFDIELDPSWTDESAIDLQSLMRVGTILMQNRSGDYFAAWSRLRIHCEMMSWHPGAKDDSGAVVATPDWTVTADQVREVDPSGPPRDGTLWAWIPTQDSATGRDLIPAEEADPQEGDYVSVVGALISDDPHWDKDFPQQYTAASKAWGDHPFTYVWRYAEPTKEDPANPSRWTEIHPPDAVTVIRLAPAPPPNLTVRCVAVIAQAGFNWANSKTLDLDIPSPGLRPDPMAQLQIAESVGPETIQRTIVEGNADHSGADTWVTIAGDGTGTAHVHVKVQAHGGFWPVFGQFKAIYREGYSRFAPKVQGNNG